MCKEFKLTKEKINRVNELRYPPDKSSSTGQ